MKKILGIDLGTTSIGWAYIHEAEHKHERSKIIKAGVRIVPLTTDEKDEFSKGNALSTNLVRTQKRGARRNHHRYKLRRDRLIRILKDIGFIAPDNDLLSTDAIALYRNRAEATQRKIEKQDLAKVLLRLNSKRGYKSNRKTNDDENDSDYLARISERDKELIDRGITVGQKGYELLQMDANTPLKGRVYSRHSYFNEFNTIWEEQAKHYPELTDALKNVIRDEIIFYQRDLKSQKGLLSTCEFEKHHRVIPASSPLFQEFRLWQRIHDIKITDSYSDKYPLTQEQKEFLFDTLQEVPKLTGAQVLRKLGYHTKAYNINFKKIDGNTTKAALLDIFKDIGYDTTAILDLDIYREGNAFDKQPAIQLWHLIYAAKDTEHLIKNLEAKFGFNAQQATTIAKTVHYSLRYGNLSARAIRNILPYMQQGLNYKKACEAAGYRHSNWETKDETKTKVLDDTLQLLDKNSLRNPVVEKILNQLINLINTISANDTLGRPDEIRIEMARQLKMNAKKRKIQTKRIADTTKTHEHIRKVLKDELGILRPSRNDIIKYKLAEETNWVSLYSGKTIKRSELFTAAYDIEHIIPKARLFDDSYMNKTICEAPLNRRKGNQTAYDFMQSEGEDNFNKFINAIKNNKALPNPKRAKLLMSADKIPKDFIKRQMSDTQYITKKAKDILGRVCKDLTITSGSVTDLLKTQWELKYIIQELNLEKYRAIGQTQFRTIKTNGNTTKQIEQIFHVDKKGNNTFWSKRDDHRHHALDAIVVALTKKKHIQHLNTLNATFDERYPNGKDLLQIAAQSFEKPWKHIRKDIATALECILISFKQKNKVVTKTQNTIRRKTKTLQPPQTTLTPRGPLHEDTIYGKIKRIKDVSVKLNAKFSPKDAEQIVNGKVKALVLAHLKRFDNDPKKAFSAKALKTTPIVHKGKPLTSVQCYEHIYVVRKPINDSLKIDQVIDKGIQRILQERLNQYGGTTKKAFSNLEEDPIYLNKAKNIQIKHVRIKSRYTHLEHIGRGYVNLGNNHHIAIYKDKNGKIHGEKVSFFEAVERARQQLPVINTTHSNGWTYLYNIQINDYFILFDDTVTPDTNVLDQRIKPLLSQRLFRVQKITILSSGQPMIVFRHHLETTLNNTAPFATKTISSFNTLHCQKVQVNRLGDIVKVGEY